MGGNELLCDAEQRPACERGACWRIRTWAVTFIAVLFSPDTEDTGDANSKGDSRCFLREEACSSLLLPSFPAQAAEEMSNLVLERVIFCFSFA